MGWRGRNGNDRLAIASRPINKFWYVPSVPTPLPVVSCCAPLAAVTMSDAEAEQLEQLFRALGDRHRIKLINRLVAAGGDAVCVCDLQDLLGLKQSNISYHLKQLFDAGLIDRAKRGKYMYYSLSAGALERVRSLLELPAAEAAA
jgi:ArsR family transcriptional regulator